MKKIILLFVAVFAFTLANAQAISKSQKADAAGRASISTDKMLKILALTPDQKAKAQAINLETFKLMDLNETTNAGKPNEAEVEKQRINKKWETEMSAVITAEQMTKWKQHKADEKK